VLATSGSAPCCVKLSTPKGRSSQRGTNLSVISQNRLSPPNFERFIDICTSAFLSRCLRNTLLISRWWNPTDYYAFRSELATGNRGRTRSVCAFVFSQFRHRARREELLKAAQVLTSVAQACGEDGRLLNGSEAKSAPADCDFCRRQQHDISLFAAPAGQPYQNLSWGPMLRTQPLEQITVAERPH
jgi:hypothetical protein